MNRTDCPVCNMRGIVIHPLTFLSWHERSDAEDCRAYLPLLRSIKARLPELGW